MLLLGNIFRLTVFMFKLNCLHDVEHDSIKNCRLKICIKYEWNLRKSLLTHKLLHGNFPTFHFHPAFISIAKFSFRFSFVFNPIPFFLIILVL